jgi:KDO2-lipid IV(A) lauroyltransferase
VFQELLKNIFDVAAFPRWSAVVQERELSVQGVPHLKEALAAGRGALLIGCHQGAFELIPVALAREGFDVHAFSRPVAEPRLDRWLSEHREALGIRTLPRDGLTAALRARRLLGGGGIVAVLLDHKIRRGGVMVEFFGRPARFATGPIRLALATGAPIVPVRIGRRSDGRHEVTIGKPVPAADPTLPHSEQCRALLRSCVAELESMIRSSPAEWAWMHRRWPSEGSPSSGKRTNRQPARLFGLRRAALTLALPAVLAAGCNVSKPPGETMTEEPAGPASAIGGFQLSETESGRLKWILRADSAETFDNALNQTIVTGVHVDFYDASRQVYSALTADEASVQSSTNDMSASGNVRVVTRDGDTLTTNTLEWNSAPGRVRTKDPFRLARPDAVLTGTGFESDPGLKNYTTEDVRIDARGGNSRPDAGS